MTDYSQLQTDTIAAISTAPGEAGIGIVRLSGPEAINIAKTIFSTATGDLAKSHRVHYGFIIDPKTQEALDEVLLTIMRAPRTFTREDVVEINCHGGSVPVRRVLEAVIKQGARIAEPGEFTKRAFMNGRIDLTQAEAVLDVIRSQTDVAERLAIGQLKGMLSKRIAEIRDKLIETAAHVEAYLDFPEDDIEPGTLTDITASLNESIAQIEQLAGTYEEGRMFREGIKTAIVGRPNVGKSSLMNALLQRERAIVTETPGTTRDTIEEHLNINGLPLQIIDTAGIRQAHEMAEQEGVKRSLQAIEQADLVLAVLDGSQPLHPEDEQIIKQTREIKTIIVINKSDLSTTGEQTDKTEAGKAGATKEPTANDQTSKTVDYYNLAGAIKISAKTGTGIDKLKSAIYETCIGGNKHTPSTSSANLSGATTNSTLMITNVRHKNALQDATVKLRQAVLGINSEPLEIVSIELKEAIEHISEVIGAVTTDDVLNRIFSDFCIGK